VKVDLPPGKSACGCSSCGEVFTSLTAFDQHQKRAYGTSEPTICCDPAERGLVLRERTVAGETWTLWGSPGPDTDVWKD